MLLSTPALPVLAQRARAHLADALGTTSVPRVWDDQDRLPYFLRDAFDVAELELLGHPILLALDRVPTHPPLAQVRTWIAQLRDLAGQPVVYVTAALASFERRHLIEQRLPFLVPGNQLYLPDLGLDLREHFRARAKPGPTPFSPSTQALLITALLRPAWDAHWQPAPAAQALGYTPMTQSRALRELVDADLARVERTGRTQWLVMADTPRALWEAAAPRLRSPVQRTVWAALPEAVVAHARVSGASALAARSMLADPREPVLAFARADWPAMAADLQTLPAALPGTVACELWRYSPALLSGSPAVDPLSLWLSLRDSPDERVQGALEELLEALPW